MRLGVTNVGTDLHPLLYLIVGTDTGGYTGVIGVFDDTVFVEVADGRIVASTVAAAAHAHVVFLTDGI